MEKDNKQQSNKRKNMTDKEVSQIQDFPDGGANPWIWTKNLLFGNEFDSPII